MRFRILCILVLPFMLFAKPVSVDEILTNDKQFKLIGSFSYLNLLRKSQSLQTIPVQNHDNSFIHIPFYGYEHVNQDYLTFSLNARYGIHKRVEIFTTLYSFYQHSHLESNGSFSTQSNGDISSLNLGLLIEAKKEGKTPAILLGIGSDIAEKVYFPNMQKSWQYAKGYSLYALSFYTIEPIVLLLQANLGLNLAKRHNNISMDLGEVFVLSPMLYFAINPYISLNFGVRYQYQSRDKLNQQVISHNASSVGYVFGLAYELKNKLILFMDTERFDTQTYSSNTITLSLSYRI